MHPPSMPDALPSFPTSIKDYTSDSSLIFLKHALGMYVHYLIINQELVNIFVNYSKYLLPHDFWSFL